MAAKEGKWGGEAKAPPAKKGKGKGLGPAEKVPPPPLDTEGLNLNLKLVHSHGVGGLHHGRNNCELVSIADESGVGRDHVLYPTGSGLGLLRVDDQRMAFVGGSNAKTWKAGATRQVLSMQLSPNRKHVAICERVTEPGDSAIVSRVSGGAPGARQGGDGAAVQYYVSVHRNITTSLTHPKITLTYSPPPPGKFSAPGPSFAGGVRFSKLAWSGDSKLLAACADGELDDDKTSASYQAFLTLVVWEWSKDKVMAATHAPQDPKSRVDATRLSFCPTDKSCLATSGLCSLKQWTVGAAGNTVEPRSLLPPNKSTERFVDHAWMCGKAQPHEAPDRRLVVCTDGKTPAPGGSVSDQGGGRDMRRGSMAPAPQGRSFQVLVFAFSAEQPGILELVHSMYSALPAPLLGPLGGPAIAVETMAAYGKGFVVAGGGGFMQVWDRTEPPAVFPYACVKTIPTPLPHVDRSVAGKKWENSRRIDGGSMTSTSGLGLSWGGPTTTICSVVVHPSDELLVAVTTDHELLSFPLGNVDVMTGDEPSSPASSPGGDNAPKAPSPFGDPNVDGGMGAFARLGATHAGKVTCMATCVSRPLLATGGADDTVRVWDYSKWRGGGEAVYKCGDAGDGEPTCLSLHPAGTTLVVGFEGCVRLLSVLSDDLQPLREVPVTHAHAVQFSHGGHLFAVGAGLNVTLHDTLSGNELQCYTGHTAAVTSVSFGMSDLELFSSGLDGSVFGWDLTTGKFIDEVNNLSGPVPCATAVIVATPPAQYGPSPPSGGRLGGSGPRPRTAPGSPKLKGREPTATERAAERRAAATATGVVASANGSLRQVQWILGGDDKAGGKEQSEEKRAKALPSSFRFSAPVVGREHSLSGPGVAAHAAAAQGRSLLTCLVKVPGKPYLIGGSSNGNVHVYAWPLRFPKAHGAPRKAAESEEATDEAEKSSSGRIDKTEDEEAAAAAAAQAAAAQEESPSLPAHIEVFAHGCEVTQLCVSADDKLLFTGGADGSINVFRLDELSDWGSNDERAGDAFKSLVSSSESGEGSPVHRSLSSDAAGSALDAATLAELQAFITSELFNTEVVQVSVAQLEARASTASDQRKIIEGLKSENAFQLYNKDAEWAARLKAADEANAAELKAQVDKRSALEAEKRAMEAAFKQAAERRDGLHQSNTLELESQYEVKLGLEMRRYDKLSEEIELVQQRCEALLSAQDHEHARLLQEHDHKSRKHEKELQALVHHLTNDELHNRAMFKEVLEQQEHEYEAELMALMAAAQEELNHERGNTNAMRVVVQEKQKSLDTLKKRMDELRGETLRQDAALLAHKQRNGKLEATLEHFKRHMAERESTLEDKEKGILELRRNNQTLDNFRFILDHRVGQLMDERGPITKHITDLELQIDKMYDELEKEYAAKKASDTLMEHKQMKVTTLTSELKVLRGSLRDKEAYIASFKKTLSGLVSLTAAKDVEDAVKEAYQRFVKDEKPRKSSAVSRKDVATGQGANGAPDDLDLEFELGLTGSNKAKKKTVGKPPPQPSADVVEMQEALSEAYRQRDCVEKFKDELKQRLDKTRDDAAKGAAKKLEENTQLMVECNELRRENVILRRKVDQLKQLARDFEVDDRKKREDAKGAAEEGRAGMPGQAPRRPATAGAAGRVGVAMAESVVSAATDPFEQIQSRGPLGQPLMTVTKAFNKQTDVPVDQAPGIGGASGGGVAAARAGRAAVAAANVEISAQLDENQRIIAMQKLEIAQLRSEIGVPYAVAGGSGGAATALGLNRTQAREVVRLKAKNPAMTKGGAQGTVGLFPAASETGPFSSKPAVLERR